MLVHIRSTENEYRQPWAIAIVMFPIGPPYRCFTEFAPPPDPLSKDPIKKEAVNCVEFETSHGILAVLLQIGKTGPTRAQTPIPFVRPSPRWRIAVVTGHIEQNKKKMRTYIQAMWICSDCQFKPSSIDSIVHWACLFREFAKACKRLMIAFIFLLVMFFSFIFSLVPSPFFRFSCICVEHFPLEAIPFCALPPPPPSPHLI